MQNQSLELLEQVTEITESRIAEITKLHEAIIGHFRTSFENAIKIGGLLSDVKTELKHGGFEAWVTGNLPFTTRTARNYMRIFHERDRLKTETVSDLRGAHRLLTHEREGESNFIIEGIDIEEIRAELARLDKELRNVDADLPVGEQVKICLRIKKESLELGKAASEYTIRAEIELGKILNDIKANLPEWKKCNDFCKAWTELFKIKDTDPVKFTAQILAEGGDPAALEEVYEMRDEIVRFPETYRELRAVI